MVRNQQWMWTSNSLTDWVLATWSTQPGHPSVVGEIPADMWTSKHHLKPISYSRWATEAAASAVMERQVSSTPHQRMHCLLLDRSLQYHSGIWSQVSSRSRLRSSRAHPCSITGSKLTAPIDTTSSASRMMPDDDDHQTPLSLICRRSLGQQVNLPPLTASFTSPCGRAFQTVERN